MWRRKDKDSSHRRVEGKVGKDRPREIIGKSLEMMEWQQICTLLRLLSLTQTPACHTIIHPSSSASFPVRVLDGECGWVVIAKWDTTTRRTKDGRR